MQCSPMPTSQLFHNLHSKPMMGSSLLVLIIIFQTLTTVSVVDAARQDLVAGIQRLSSDVIELKNVVESSISNRCDSIRGCYKASYDECQSAYTKRQSCPSIYDIGSAIPECGRGVQCNGLFDNTITTVRLPANIAIGENGNPIDPEVIEAVCYTRTAQRWMVQKYNQDKNLWKSLNVTSPQMYFGSSTGVFRIFPARHSRECGVYDPRLRPWYQAAVPSTVSNSVKPRNVVILMDTSRSMNETINEVTGETKLSFMKKTVNSTISTLSDSATIAVVRFGEEAMLVGRQGARPPFLWQKATPTHKEMLIENITNIHVRGRSNWVSGFDLAFTLIKNSLEHIRATKNNTCELENIALLFFSDGDYNLPADASDEDIVKLVSSNVKEIEEMGDYDIKPFFYSIGNSDVNQVMKQISCDLDVDGYWTAVTGTITPSNVTSGYQALFSIPMGTSAFYNYTSWSPPYVFASSGALGYTVSALVYNRDIEPPLFMGAVGMDISAEAARRIYGENRTMDETILAMNEILENIKETKYNATCEQQRIDLTYCETQVSRQLNGGNQAICLPPAHTANLTTEEADIVLSGQTEAAESQTNPLSSTNTNTDNTLDIENSTIAANISVGGNLEGDIASDPAESEVQQVIFEQVLNCSKSFLSPCPGYDEYPNDLWRNVALQGETYKERVCCQVGTNKVSDECPKLDEIRGTKIPDAAIFGLLFGSIVLAEIVCCYFCFYYKKRRNAQN